MADQAWLPPGQRDRRTLTFEDYAERWLKSRELKPSTANLYRGTLDRTLLPEFGEQQIGKISSSDVRVW